MEAALADSVEPAHGPPQASPSHCHCHLVDDDDICRRLTQVLREAGGSMSVANLGARLNWRACLKRAHGRLMDVLERMPEAFVVFRIPDGRNMACLPNVVPGHEASISAPLTPELLTIRRAIISILRSNGGSLPVASLGGKLEWPGLKHRFGSLLDVLRRMRRWLDLEFSENGRHTVSLQKNSTDPLDSLGELPALSDDGDPEVLSRIGPTATAPSSLHADVLAAAAPPPRAFSWPPMPEPVTAVPLATTVAPLALRVGSPGLAPGAAVTPLSSEQCLWVRATLTPGGAEPLSLLFRCGRSSRVAALRRQLAAVLARRLPVLRAVAVPLSLSLRSGDGEALLDGQIMNDHFAATAGLVDVDVGLVDA